MPIDLPTPLAIYLSAEASADADIAQALEQSFAPDAEVHDEGHVHQGLARIKAWSRKARSQYQYRVEPLSVSTQGAHVSVLVRVSGQFPGSPVELNYQAELAGELIARLKIS